MIVANHGGNSSALSAALRLGKWGQWHGAAGCQRLLRQPQHRGALAELLGNTERKITSRWLFYP